MSHARTRSGLSLHVVTVARNGGTERAAREHPRFVRVAHWLNAITLIVMTMSGLQIFAAFPSFGPKIPQADLIAVPDAMRLGGWLGGALQWHFTFAWIFTVTGLAYAIYLAVSGHWRHVLLRADEVAGIWPMVRHYALFKAKPEAREPYNPLQKLAYTSTLFFGAAAIATGVLLAKPVQFSGVVSLLGGFALVRVYHFAAMAGFFAFLPGHLLMVALHGWNNFTSMITGWKRRPDYLRD